jgi:hypothetical protein
MMLVCCENIHSMAFVLCEESTITVATALSVCCDGISMMSVLFEDGVSMMLVCCENIHSMAFVLCEESTITVATALSECCDGVSIVLVWC